MVLESVVLNMNIYIFIYTGYIYSVRHGKVVIICLKNLLERYR